MNLEGWEKREYEQLDRDGIRDLLADWRTDLSTCRERVRELEEVIDGLLDGLDANSDERGGLSQAQWDRRVKYARQALAHDQTKEGEG